MQRFNFSDPHNNANYYYKKFIESYQKIESDPNYNSTINNEELLNLVIDENGNARHTPIKSAIAIQPSSFSTKLGMVYQIKIAKKGLLDEMSEYPTWHIDDSAVILVKKNGEISLHSKEHAEMDQYHQPLTHVTIDQFLGRECLHNKPSVDFTV